MNIQSEFGQLTSSFLFQSRLGAITIAMLEEDILFSVW